MILSSGTNLDEQAVVNQAAKVFIANSAGVEKLGAIGYKDVGNSTVVPLAANGVFVGASFDVTDFAMTEVLINCPQSSAANGVELQGSFDGATWEVFKTFSFVGSAATQMFENTVPFKFFRLRFVNGATLQTTLKLDVIHRQTLILPSATASNTAAINGDQNSFGTVRQLASVVSPSGTVGTRRNTQFAQGRPAVGAGLAAATIISAPGANNRLYIHRIVLTAYATALVTAVSTSLVLGASGDLGAVTSSIQCPTTAFTAQTKTVIDSQNFPIGLAANGALIATLPAVANLQWEIEVQYHIGPV